MTANPLQPIPSIGTPPSPHGGLGAQVSKFSPIDPLRVLRQYVWWLVIAAIIGAGAGIAYWWYLHEFKARFTSQARILILSGVPDGYADPERVMLHQASEIGAFIRNQLPRLTSEEVLSDVLKSERVRVTRWFNAFETMKAAREALHRSISASPERGTSLLRVDMTGSVPEDLPVVLDQVVELFVDRVRADIDLRTTDVRRTFRREVEQAQAMLKQIEEQKERFRVENDILTHQLRSSEDSGTYVEMSRLLTNLEIQIEQARDRYNALVASRDAPRAALSASDMLELEADPSIADKTATIRTLREQRMALLPRMGEKHPQIKSIDEQIRTLEQRKSLEIERLVRERNTVQVESARADLEGLERQHRHMHQKLADVRTRMRDLEEKLDEMRQLEAGASAARERQARAERLLEDMRVKSIRPDAMRIEVLTPAEEATLTFPKFGAIVPAVTLMFLGAVTGLVFLKELLDQRIKSPQDIRLIPNTELLGVLPDAAEDPISTVAFEQAVRNDPNGLLAESFRQLRTALLSRMDRRGYKTLMIVGTAGSGGVSSVVSNLAVSMAHNGRRVLVIDANFRRPNQHQMFGTPLKPGLFEVLKQAVSFEDAVAHVEEPAVDVLSTGDAHLAPPEILEGHACRSLLSDLEAQYDVILFDAPPALVASECQLLAKHVDAIAPIIRALSEKRGMISRMLRQFDGYRADLLGVVLNGVKSSAGGYFRKSYEEFYEYRQNGNGHSADAEAEEKTNAA